MENTSLTREKIEKLISKVPEVYQSVYLHGNLVREGVRQNDWERLEAIKQYIKPKQTILDIGSNAGFFTIQLAKLFPENVFLSIESNSSYAKLQRELLIQEKLENVILVNSQVTVDWLEQAAIACVYFDVTFLLSVLHHMKNAIQFLEKLSKISKSLLIEMPNPNETRVCGKHILKNQLNINNINKIKPVFKKLNYEANTHCDNRLKRFFYYADSPKYKREAYVPYIGYPLPPRQYIIKNDDTKVTLHKTHLEQNIELSPGILVYDAAKIGSIEFPTKEEFGTQIDKQFEFLDKIENAADIRPWNLLFTAKGLKFIDYKYTNDLSESLHYQRERDFKVVSNYLVEIFRKTSKPVVLIDCVFFQLFQTGIARVWRSLIEEWANTSFCNHIVVLDRAQTAPRIPGIRYRTIPAYNVNDLEGDRQLLQQICDEEGADLFISSYYTTPLSTLSVMMVYDMIPETLGWDIKHPNWRGKHHAIEYASSYLAISENTASDLIKFFPDISSESITVAHCGVKSSFTPASVAEINQFKTNYGISNPYFLLVGASGGYKNVFLFFRAFAQLFSRGGFEIVCVGSQSLLKEDFRIYTSGSPVHILQLSDEELKAAYSGAVALVYPSKLEGFGLPILEAIACGCPVITCPNASIPEVAAEAAIYVNDEDVSGMANALCEVQKPDVRNSLIAAGLKQAKQFSWAKMAQTVSSVLIDAPLQSLNLREINLIIFPDWSAPEESLGLELQEVVKAIATHLNKSDITLLVDTTDISAEDANLFLSGVAMNLMIEEDIEVSDDMQISLIGQLSVTQWQTLLPYLQGRIGLENENLGAIHQAQAETLNAYPLDSLSNLAGSPGLSPA